MSFPLDIRGITLAICAFVAFALFAFVPRSQKFPHVAGRGVLSQVEAPIDTPDPACVGVKWTVNSVVPNKCIGGRARLYDPYDLGLGGNGKGHKWIRRGNDAVLLEMDSSWNWFVGSRVNNKFFQPNSMHPAATFER